MDLILLHAPSVFDFRRQPIFFGPVSDVVPSTPVFEMYPVGLASLSAYLEERGFKVRIINLAYRMLENPNFDPVAMIRNLSAPLFGIDLHWLPHAHGSLEVARLVKENHPRSKVIFGGLSSTYYHQELIGYPYVDFVLRGDSTEEPLRRLMEAMRNGGGYEEVPNLTWKNEKGEAEINPLSYVPSSLDYATFDFRNLLRQVIRHRDLKSVIPFQDWLKYPITMTLACRGCTENCIICGGSNYAFRRFYGRSQTGFRSPERLTQDIVNLSRMTRAPIFIIGDFRQAGEEYAEEVLTRLASADVRNEIVMEFFRSVDENFMKKIARSLNRFSMEISPETHDEETRIACGKRYTNEELENTIRFAIAHGARKVDIFFMTGLTRQDYASVMKTAGYARKLIGIAGKEKNVFPFISPLAPFLDPGSIAFENAETFGYRLRMKSLEEHRRALLSPSWKHSLNYETEWMTRHEIAVSTYEAALNLVNARSEAGILSKGRAEEQKKRILQSMKLMEQLERLEDEDGQAAVDLVRKFAEGPDKAQVSTLNDHREIRWPFKGRGIRLRATLSQSLKWLINGRT